MPTRTRVVIGGVDPHGRTHHAAGIDQQGRLLGDREFPASSGGYRHLLGWLRRHGNPDTVGVEGTGSYGAGLTRFLLDHGVNVVESTGRTDAPAASAASRIRSTPRPPPAPCWPARPPPGQATRRHRRVDPGTPGCPHGAIKARTAAIHQLKGLLVTTPASLREALEGRSTAALAAACARLRPDETALADPVDATKAALRVVACRIHQLDEEIGVADQRLAKLVGRAAPRLVQLHAIGVDHAGQLLTPPASAPSDFATRRPSRTCAGPRRSPPARADPPAPAPPWR